MSWDEMQFLETYHLVLIHRKIFLNVHKLIIQELT